MTMLVVTHEMQFAREVGDHLIFMDEGRIVEQGEPADVLDRPQRGADAALPAPHASASRFAGRAHSSKKEGLNETHLLVAAAIVLVAAAFTAWGVAAPGGKLATTAVPSAKPKAKPKLPALPAQVKQRGRWIIGVKCDAPPFGYIDMRGENAGFDVDIARRSRASRSGGRTGDVRVRADCVPRAAPDTGRVDLVISTFTYTADRDTRIDFSRPYYKASGRLLVPNNSQIRGLNDIRGKSIATTDGSIYDAGCGAASRHARWSRPTVSRPRC